MMLTLYGCAMELFGLPLEVGDGPSDVVGEGEGTSGLSCVAQASMYAFVTPAPLAFGPDWSCPFPKPPHDWSPDPVMIPLYARRSQTSDRYFPLASCPPNTIVSDAAVLG